MSYRIGVDIGGTFTDFALYGADSGTMAIHKLLTTQSDPSEAVLAGVGALLDRNGVTMDAVRRDAEELGIASDLSAGQSNGGPCDQVENAGILIPGSVFGARHVDHDADGRVQLVRSRPHLVDCRSVSLRRAMAQVQPSNAHAVDDETSDGLVRGR